MQIGFLWRRASRAKKQLFSPPVLDLIYSFFCGIFVPFWFNFSELWNHTLLFHTGNFLPSRLSFYVYHTSRPCSRQHNRRNWAHSPLDQPIFSLKMLIALFFVEAEAEVGWQWPPPWAGWCQHFLHTSCFCSVFNIFPLCGTVKQQLCNHTACM